MVRTGLGSLNWIVPAIVFSIPMAAAARGQCGPSFVRGFGSNGTDGPVMASALHDDGSGPALHVGGNFGSAGSVATFGVARWDGAAWSPFTAALWFPVRCLVSFDAGGGASLYAGGGNLTGQGPVVDYIARWNGSAWVPAGNGALGAIFSMCVYNDGTGPALYVAHASLPGPGFSFGVSRWNGTSWSAVGAPVFTDVVTSLVPHDDGSGPSLWAGGPTVLGSGLVRWNGAAWVPMAPGAGVSGIRSMATFDEGQGPVLFLAGFFNTIGGVAAVNIARWNGAAFSAVGPGLTSTGPSQVVECLGVFDFGSGPSLFAGGDFTNAGPVACAGFARWDGSAWSGPVGSNLPPSITIVRTLTAWNGDPQGPSLFAGGQFESFGTAAARNVARWDGAAATSLGNENGVGLGLASLAFHDDGTGPALYAGGSLASAGSALVQRIARFDGTSWSGLPGGLDGYAAGIAPIVKPIGTLNFLGFPYLVVGGNFANVTAVPSPGLAFFGPSGWLPSPGGGVQLPTGAGVVHAMATRPGPFGEELFLGGQFNAAGGIAAQNVAHWTGLAWQPLGAGLSGGAVSALRWFDSGQGGRLHAAGSFTSAGGIPATGYAVWDGAAWSVPAGTLSPQPWVTPIPWLVADLEVFDDGTGPAIYAAGTFRLPAPWFTTGIARWTGTGWAGVGGGISGPSSQSPTGIGALEVFDDGRGPALYALGGFTQAGAVPARNIARWDGTSWEALSGGLPSFLPSSSDDLAAADFGGGPVLFAGGFLSGSSGVPSRNLAAWSVARPRLVLEAPAGGVMVRNLGLSPGDEVFNVFSLEPCPGIPGSGPYLGLCASNLGFLLAQVAFPIGTVPFHYAALGPDYAFGPYPLPSGLAFDALCIAVTNGAVCPSLVRRFVVP